MRNIINEQPTRDLHGGPAFARSFVDVDDCRERSILDIGCGFGWFELIALDRDAHSVAAVEPTADDIATARAHIRDERVDFRIASALDLPFEDAAFDTVVCWEVLEHLPRESEPQAFAEVARVLRPGGVLYLSTPYGDLRSRITDPAWWLIRHRHYSDQRLRELAGSAGFVVERLLANGAWWQVLAMSNLYVAKWIFRRRPFFEDRISRRVDAEWSRLDGGFTNIFLKARKL
jgi:SAM-dependent methyltransferase